MEGGGKYHMEGGGKYHMSLSCDEIINVFGKNLQEGMTFKLPELFVDNNSGLVI